MNKNTQFHHELTPSEVNYGLVIVRSFRGKLPAPGRKVIIIDDLGREYISKMHSSQSRIDGLTEWYKNHPHVKVGDTISLTLESNNRLRLTVGSKAKSRTQHMNYQNDVAVALDIVLETFENIIEELNQEGTDAFQKGDYKCIHKIAEKGNKLNEFRGKVSTIKKEWDAYFASQSIKINKSTQTGSSRLERGLRTPENIFRIPILQILVEFGGSASATKIIDKLNDILESELNEYDNSPLPSSGIPRWINTAHWTRYELVKDGFLSSESPRGIWQITNEGIEWLNTVNSQ